MITFISFCVGLVLFYSDDIISLCVVLYCSDYIISLCVSLVTQDGPPASQLQSDPTFYDKLKTVLYSLKEGRATTPTALSTPR